MAVKYHDHIAAQVLSEGQILSYRNVSRALKVHVNVAKQMLYDFHRIQNGKKPGSIHATYLICGIRKPAAPHANGVHAAGDGDVEMQDSLPPSSAPEPNSSLPPSSLPDQDAEPPSEDVPVTSITIVREEELESVKKRHTRIDAIHIYSLQQSPIEHMQLLSDCTRRLAEVQAKEDPLESWKQYGTIHNPKAKRRTGARPPAPAPAPAVPMTAGMKATAKPAAGAPGVAKQNEGSRPSSSTKEGSKEDKPPKQASKPPSLKKEGSSLFKSFAKTKVPEKKKEEDIEVEDQDMAEASEDEEESEILAPPQVSEEVKAKSEAQRKAKLDREATLKKMMEDDEEEANKPNEEEDAEMQDPSVEESSAPTKDGDSQQEAPGETQEVSAEGGRRRGRRRVMKKKYFKDAEGYMVTKEEPVWESFSEDEAAPPPAKKPATSTSTFKSSKDDRTKKAGKPGQGNIMSFFGKK